MSKLRNTETDLLFEGILKLETVEECYRFFTDICTIKEVQDMAQRFEAAILLDQGEGYQTISDQVGISTATISRVSRCLNYGAGGYACVINRMKEEGLL